MTASELTILFAQVNQPWVVPYSTEFGTCLCLMPHLYGTHTVLHAAKSVGKLAAVFEEIDHTGEPPTPAQIEIVRQKCADLFTTCLRLANLYKFDLAAALVERVEEKNGVNILNIKEKANAGSDS